VDVQATVLSYMDIFLYIGMMFLVCIPFVLILIKRPLHKADPADMLQE